MKTLAKIITCIAVLVLIILIISLSNYLITNYKVSGYSVTNEPLSFTASPLTGYHSPISVNGLTIPCTTQYTLTNNYSFPIQLTINYSLPTQPTNYPYDYTLIRTTNYWMPKQTGTIDGSNFTFTGEKVTPHYTEKLSTTAIGEIILIPVMLLIISILIIKAPKKPISKTLDKYFEAEPKSDLRLC